MWLEIIKTIETNSYNLFNFTEIDCWFWNSAFSLKQFYLIQCEMSFLHCVVGDNSSYYW